MLAEQKVYNCIKDCQRALNTYREGNKRLAVGSLDGAKESVIAAIHLLINEIIEEEGGF